MPSQTEVDTALDAAKSKWSSGNGAEHVQAHASDQLASEADRVICSLDAVESGLFGGNEVERQKVRAAARRLLARVETPLERALGLCFEQPVVFAALQTCIDLGLWRSWTAIGGEKSIDELVAFTTPTVDSNLLRKLSFYSLRTLNQQKPHETIQADCSAYSLLSMWLRRQRKTDSNPLRSRMLSATRAPMSAPRFKRGKNIILLLV